MSKQLDSFMSEVIAKNPGEKEFHQAVYEVAASLMPFIEQEPKYKKAKILERLVEPERVVMFRVTWVDDNGEIQVNRGYRVQMNSAIGPYKGGLRFDPSVNLSVLKFLAFEQVFKNSLTTLPLGGGKGGADFDPRGKSDQEVMRFCQAFMNELYRHIGPDTDVPAGDIGVGGREIGYLFGQYRKIRNSFDGAITGKGFGWGGSLIRPEATGYGVVYFLREMLKAKGEDLKGKTIAISGYGNVGSYFIEKALQYGAKVVTIADDKGYVYDPEGISGEKLEYLKDLWVVHRRPARDFAEKFGLKWIEGRKPWEVPCDIAVPTATQNELDLEGAKNLAQNGCKCVVEAANMPCTPEAVEVFESAGILFAPGKAANAGGVAVSGLEMCQNSQHICWCAEEVDSKLQDIMKNIHHQCVAYGKEKEQIDYVKGANIAGFIRVADAMIAQGII
ncbi:MAG TPA: NADP-specific glutamate dehydrogenase [Syntrophomonadaceae bacterium]|nr:NADP-specific glutamate dehydrogenase [Syntrophomonadaceae bacterium]